MHVYGTEERVCCEESQLESVQAARPVSGHSGLNGSPKFSSCLEIQVWRAFSLSSVHKQRRDWGLFLHFYVG